MRAIDSWEIFPFLFYFYINNYILNSTLFSNVHQKRLILKAYLFCSLDVNILTDYFGLT